jgi:hypothetical protein
LEKSGFAKQRERQGIPSALPRSRARHRTTGKRTASSLTRRHKVEPGIANPRVGIPWAECRYRSPPRCDPDHSQAISLERRPKATRNSPRERGAHAAKPAGRSHSPGLAHVPAGHRSKLPGATAMRQVQVRDEDSLVVAVLVGIVLVSAASFAVAFFLH